MSVAWVGAGIAAVGVASSVSSANKATDAASDASDSSLAFEQEKYDDWQNTYGGLQDSLSEYYNSLSSESYAAMGLENAQVAFDTSMANINESLAQRGITNSAVGASIEAQAELGLAEQKAEIRTTADSDVASEQMNFLQVGLGLDPSSSMSSTLASQSSQLQATAAAQEAAAGQAISSGLSTIGTTVGNYLADQDSDDTTGLSTSDDWV